MPESEVGDKQVSDLETECGSWGRDNETTVAAIVFVEGATGLVLRNGNGFVCLSVCAVSTVDSFIQCVPAARHGHTALTTVRAHPCELSSWRFFCCL